MNNRDRFLEIVKQALNRVCDYDLMGNPITDYSVLMMGAYSPAIHRVIDAVAAELAAAQEREAKLREALEKADGMLKSLGQMDLHSVTLRTISGIREQIRAALSQPSQAPAQGEPAKRESVQHIDDAAVDRFAIAMKAKMAKSREKGRNGWDDPKQCSLYALWSMLIEHVDKGDPVDVGNFAMMIYNREAAAPKEHDHD